MVECKFNNLKVVVACRGYWELVVIRSTEVAKDIGPRSSLAYIGWCNA